MINFTGYIKPSEILTEHDIAEDMQGMQQAVYSSVEGCIRTATKILQQLVAMVCTGKTLRLLYVKEIS
jgi:hypothetical protein